MTGAHTAALHLVQWLDRALLPGGAVRERYKLSTQTWNPTIRPDCNAETLAAFLKAAEATSDAAWLTKARGVWDAFKVLQNPDGSWPFTAANPLKAINDNAEVSIYLIRSAPLDVLRGGEYLAAGLATVEWIITQQWPDGGWYGADYDQFVKAG